MISRDELADFDQLMMLVATFGERLIVQHNHETPPPELTVPHMIATTDCYRLVLLPRQFGLQSGR